VVYKRVTMNQRMVSSLYTIDGERSKQKTLEIIRVMKGAISVSKSKTGEVIYRSNKLENDGLQRQLKRFEKAKIHTIDSYDSRKRTTLRRWALVFEKQKSMNESIREFEMILSKAIIDVDESVPTTLPKLPVSKLKEGENDDDKNKKGEDKNEEGTEEEEEKKRKEEEAVSMMKRRGITRLRLQPIGVGKNSQIKVVLPPTPPPQIVEEKWPLENATWINNYIQHQKKRHETLITKNTLERIKTGLTKAPALFKFRLRANLSEDPRQSIEAIKSARSSRSARVTATELASTDPQPSTARGFNPTKVRFSQTSCDSVKPSPNPLPPLNRSNTMI